MSTYGISSTMQDDVPLSLGNLARHGLRAFADSTITSYDGRSISKHSFAEMGARAAQLAHALRDRFGIGVGDPVASFMWNTVDHLASYIAVPGMGAVLQTLNIRYSVEQAKYTIEGSGVKIVIVDGGLVSEFVEIARTLTTIDDVIVTGAGDVNGELADLGFGVHAFDELLSVCDDTFDWVEVPETSPALMCYTSGTTGDPKGVVYSHRSVFLSTVQLCMGDYLGLTRADRALVVVPMFHANSWYFPYAALMVGAELILPSRYVQPEHIGNIIASESPTVSGGVPTIWSDLLQHARQRGLDFSSLRRVIVGGSLCPQALREAYQSEFGVTLMQAWGLTEITPGSIAFPGGLDAGGAERIGRTQGRLRSGVDARVVADDGVVLPSDGVSIGEIEIRAPWAAAGYHNKAVESGAGGWLRTEDVGTISEDRLLTLHDRSKDVIKSGGEWISSIELEQVIHAHPAVVEVAVVGVTDERWGERPWAVVRLSSEGAAEARQLADHVGAFLDRWQVPERWTFVAELPRTSAGKIDKAALRALYAAEDVTVNIVKR